MIGGIGKLAKGIGKKTAAVSLKKGVAMTVASATLITSAANAMSLTQASDLVNYHSKAVNKEANLAAEILKIDRSELVNKNYLRLASRIDDYLTGKTKELVIDASMLNEMKSQSSSNESAGTSENQNSIETSTNDDESLKALSAIQSVTPNGVTSTQVSDAIESRQPDSKVFDVTSALSQALDESPKTDETTANTVSEIKNLVKDSDSSDNHILDKSELSSVAASLKDMVKSTEEPKIAEKITNISSSTPKPIERIESRVESLVQPELPEYTKPISDKGESLVQPELPEYTQPIADKGESLVQPELPEYNQPISDKGESLVQPELPEYNQPISDKGESLVQPELPEYTRPISDKGESLVQPELPEYDASTTVASDDGNSGTTVSSVEKRDEEITGKFVIHVKRQFSNNRKIDDFDIVKTTRGIRHADGSETWESITFTAADLSADQMTATSGSGLHRLLRPQFSVTYTPKSSSQEVHEIISYGKAEKIEKPIKPVEDVTRTIRLIKEDGSELRRITQRVNEPVEIPKTIEDVYTDRDSLSIEYDTSDIDITYHPINSRITKSETYLIKDVIPSGAEIRRENRVLNVTYNRNNMTNVETKEIASVESQISQANLEGYTSNSIQFNHSTNEVIRTYTRIEKVEDPKPIASTTAPTVDKIYSAAVTMLETMPSLSNRAEYSKYTSLDDSYGKLLQRETIESLVFGISDGRYVYSTSDRVLEPSQNAVLAAEVNSRFTDRLVERINEYRRSIGLNEVKKVATTGQMDRQFVSTTIFNYLANNHSNSKVGHEFERLTGLERIETMQPVHTLSTTKQGLTPEAAADSLFRTILKEANSYKSKDGGETGHLEQLIDPDQKEIYAGMFIGDHEIKDTFVGMFGKQIKSGTKSSYKISTTLHYFK